MFLPHISTRHRKTLKRISCRVDMLINYKYGGKKRDRNQKLIGRIQC